MIGYEDFSHAGWQPRPTKVRQISISDKTLLDAATVKRHRAIVRFFVVSCHETHVGLFETSWVIFPGSEVSASN